MLTGRTQNGLLETMKARHDFYLSDQCYEKRYQRWVRPFNIRSLLLLSRSTAVLCTAFFRVYQETAPMPSFMNEEHILPPGYNTKNHGDSPTGETSDLPAESNPTMNNLQLGDSLAREKVAGATIFHAAQPKYAQRTELPRRDSTAGFFPKDTMVSPGTLELQQLLLISNLSSLTAVLNQVVVEISQSARDSRCAVETSGAISENLKVPNLLEMEVSTNRRPYDLN